MGKGRSCHWVQDQLPAYLDQGLTARDYGVIQQHLEKCKDCREEYALLVKDNASLSRLRSTLLLRDLWQDIKETIQANVGKKNTLKRSGLHRVFKPFLSPFTAIAVAAVLLVGIGLYWQSRMTQSFERIFPGETGFVRATTGSIVKEVSEYAYALEKGALHVQLKTSRAGLRLRKLCVQTGTAQIEVLDVDTDGVVEYAVEIEGQTGLTVVKSLKGIIRVVSSLSSMGGFIVKSGENLYVSAIVIEQVYGDTNGWYGQKKSHTVQVKNQGKEDMDQVTLKVYLSEDEKLDEKDRLAQSKEVGTIEIGKQIQIEFDLEIPTEWENKVRKVYVLTIIAKESKSVSNIGARVIGMTQIPEDVNGDGVVDEKDIYLAKEALIKGYLHNPSADVNRDGIINVSDIHQIVKFMQERK